MDTYQGEGKWSEPKPLCEIINKVQIKKEEWTSSKENSIFTNDGFNYYFAAMLKGRKSIDTFQTKLFNNEFSQPLKINGLFEDDEYWKSTPTFSPDGNYMFFNS